jgi:hypothetical protein
METELTEEQIVEVGETILKELNINPALRTDELAELTGLEPEVVALTLDQCSVTADGEVQFVGRGQGGGWLTEAVAESVREIPYTPRESTHVGYRWPDGEIRQEVFDSKNPEHLQVLGLEQIQNA